MGNRYVERRLRAAALAVVVMVLTAVPAFAVALVVVVALFLNDGGTFGGMGSSALDDYEPRTWSKVLAWAAWATAALVVAAVGRLTYRSALRSQECTGR